MSKTTTALLAKLAITFIAAWVTFSVFQDNPVGWVFLLSVAGAAINYLVGDLMVLPAYGNITASLGDGVTAAVVAYIIDLLSPRFNATFSTLVFFAFLVAVGEFFFHKYLKESKAVAP